MEENKKEMLNDQPNKMSYEQLTNIVHQLSEQSRTLYRKLQEANMANLFKRLDLLFKVVENSHAFNQDFVNKCVAEIEDLMTIPESEDNAEVEDTKE